MTILAPRPSRRHPGWPVSTGSLPSGAGQVALRRLRRGDGAVWGRIRLRDEEVLARWEVSSARSWQERHGAAGWRHYRGAMVAAARIGLMVPMAITVDGAFAGQVTIGGIVRGALSSGWIGYWVDSAVQRRGVASAAVALGIVHAFGPVGLHRIEATIAPANVASLATARRLGLRREGLLRRYLDIDGAWRDHELYAMTVEELPVAVDSAPGVDIARALVERDPLGRGGEASRKLGEAGEN